jgi:hypothetical protein
MYSNYKDEEKDTNPFKNSNVRGYKHNLGNGRFTTLPKYIECKICHQKYYDVYKQKCMSNSSKHH